MTDHQIEMAKNGYPIPVINDVHLHSLYDPIKEAQDFVKQHEAELLENRVILVLGLGFGYHIREIIDFQVNHHRKDAKLAIIEPSLSIIEDCKRLNLLPEGDISIFHAEDPIALYSNQKLIHFLLQRPHLLFHPATYNVYSDYFKAYLSYRPDNKIQSLLHLIQNEELKNYLQQFSLDFELKDILEKLHQKGPQQEMDFLLLAYDQIR